MGSSGVFSECQTSADTTSFNMDEDPSMGKGPQYAQVRHCAIVLAPAEEAVWACFLAHRTMVIEENTLDIGQPLLQQHISPDLV